MFTIFGQSLKRKPTMVFFKLSEPAHADQKCERKWMNVINKCKTNKGIFWNCKKHSKSIYHSKNTTELNSIRISFPSIFEIHFYRINVKKFNGITAAWSTNVCIKFLFMQHRNLLSLNLLVWYYLNFELEQ